MADHRLFFYPYASFTDRQLSLLKLAALWADKLILLDPRIAAWDVADERDGVGDAVRQLRYADILEVVAPEEVMADHEAEIAEGIRRDLADEEFMRLCQAHENSTRQRRWSLARSKVPDSIWPPSVHRFYAQMVGVPVNEEFQESWAIAQRESFAQIAWQLPAGPRYMNLQVPLAVGEAVMMNHALFAGLVQAEATPITGDSFHHEALQLKLRRAVQEPAVAAARADRLRARRLRADLLSYTALPDIDLNLPWFGPEMPLPEILEYRRAHGDELNNAREMLSTLGQRIKAEPWSVDFAGEVEHNSIPDLRKALDDARRAHADWLRTRRGRLTLGAAGVALGSASAVLSIVAAPAAPIALAAAALALGSGAALPAGQWLLDWRDARTSGQENGLHYLLRI
jgi:hypothetical protein